MMRLRTFAFYSIQHTHVSIANQPMQAHKTYSYRNACKHSIFDVCFSSCPNYCNDVQYHWCIRPFPRVRHILTWYAQMRHAALARFWGSSQQQLDFNGRRLRLEAATTIRVQRQVPIPMGSHLKLTITMGIQRQVPMPIGLHVDRTITLRLRRLDPIPIGLRLELTTTIGLCDKGKPL